MRVKTPQNKMLEEHLLGNSWTILKGLEFWTIQRPHLFQHKMTGRVCPQAGGGEQFIIDPDPRKDDLNTGCRALWEGPLHRKLKGQKLTAARAKETFNGPNVRKLKKKYGGKLSENLQQARSNQGLMGWIDEADTLPEWTNGMEVSADWTDPRMEKALADWPVQETTGVDDPQASDYTVKPGPVTLDKPHTPWTPRQYKYNWNPPWPYQSKPDSTVNFNWVKPAPMWNTRQGVNDRVTPTQVNERRGAKAGRLFPADNSVSGAFYEQAPGGYYQVRGELTVYFEDPRLYSLLAKRQAELQERIRETINKAMRNL